MRFHLVDSMDQVVELALLPATEPAPDANSMDNTDSKRATDLVPPTPQLYPVPDSAGTESDSDLVPPATSDDISDQPSANQN
jgi:hypothetical protein